MPVQISITETINAPALAVFDAAVSIDARELIQQHGLMPAITHVDGHDAPWSEIGQARKHTLSDNSSVYEELVAFTRGQTFAYRLSGFTGLFAPLVSEARAEWHFTTRSAESSKIDWTYIFSPNDPIAEPVLWFIVKTLWPGYLKSALHRVKQKAESQST